MAVNPAFYRIVVVGFIALVLLMLRYRLKSWESREKLDRRQEGVFILATLRPVALLVYVGIFAYMIKPEWMAWSSWPLPTWLRWSGAVILALGIAFLGWTLESLGKNLTDTVVTRSEHTLVTHGPYRWIRHPFYDCVLLFLLAISLLAANWFMLIGAVLVFALVAIRTKTEEANLAARFGGSYDAYRARTGKFLPRL